MLIKHKEKYYRNGEEITGEKYEEILNLNQVNFQLAL